MSHRWRVVWTAVFVIGMPWPWIPPVTAAVKIVDPLDEAIALLDSPSVEKRCAAAISIPLHLERAKVAIPRLLEMADEDSAAEARMSAFLALGMLQVGSSEACKLYVKHLNDPSPLVRPVACMALTNCEEVPAEALRLIDTWIAGDDPAMREAAMTLLGGSTEDHSAESIDRVLKRLESESIADRLLGLRELRHVGWMNEPALNRVVRFLDSDSSHERGSAIETLPFLGPKGMTILFNRETDESKLSWAAEVPFIMLPPDRSAILVLNAMRSPCPRLRLWGAEKAPFVKAMKREVFEQLLVLLEDEDADVRSEASYIGIHINAPDEPYVIPGLVRALRVEDATTRAIVAVTLASKCKEVRPEIEQAARSPNANVRAGIARTLGMMATESTAAGRLLAELLRDDDPLVRTSTAEAMRWLCEGTERFELCEESVAQVEEILSEKAGKTE